MGAVEESIQLENKILSNKISKKQLVKEIESIEKKYGEDAFLPYNLVKKEKITLFNLKIVLLIIMIQLIK